MHGYAKKVYFRFKRFVILGPARGAAMRVYIEKGQVRVGYIAWLLRINGKCKFYFSVLNELINWEKGEQFYLLGRKTRWQSRGAHWGWVALPVDKALFAGHRLTLVTNVNAD